MSVHKNSSRVTPVTPRQTKGAKALPSKVVNGAPTETKTARKESTRDALLRVMVTTIDEHGEPGVRIEKVLHDANASVSSIYHHFGSLGGLIEVAQIERIRRTQLLDIDFFEEQVKSATTVDEFKDVVTRGIERAFHEDRRIVRAQRINAAARAYQNSRYEGQLGELQREANTAIGLVLTQAQARGLIPSHVDIEIAAAWWTSTLCARYFVDILGVPSLEDRWNNLARQFVFAVLDIAG